MSVEGKWTAGGAGRTQDADFDWKTFGQTDAKGALPRDLSGLCL